MGRKKLSPKNRLEEQCRFRIEPDMMQELETGAEQAGVSLSNLYRACIRASVYNDRTAKVVCNLVRDAIADYKSGEEQNVQG